MRNLLLVTFVFCLAPADAVSDPIVGSDRPDYRKRMLREARATNPALARHLARSFDRKERGAGLAPKVIDDGNVSEPRGEGILGGSSFDAIVDPDDNSVFLAAGEGGIFRSVDGGESWVQTFFGTVYSISVIPDTPRRFVGVVACGRLVLSNDGVTWTSPSGTFPSCAGEVDVDPQDPDRLLIHDGFWDSVSEFDINNGWQGIGLSEDGGQTIVPLDLGLVPNVDEFASVTAAFVPDSPGTIVVSLGISNFANSELERGGLLISTNSGQSFQDSSDGLAILGGDLTSRVRLDNIDVDPRDPDIWYTSGSVLGTNDSLFFDLFRSPDRGTTWVRVSDFGGFGASLNFDPESNRIFAVNTGLSTDNGLTWDFESVGIGFVYALVFVPQSDRVLAAIDGEGALISTDDGQTYREPQAGFDGAQRIQELAISPGGTVLASSFGIGIYRSTDLGRTWSRRTTSRVGTLVRDIHYAPGVSGMVYAATSDENAPILRSVDDGQTWSGLDFRGALNMPDGADSVAVDPSNPNRILAGLDGSTTVLLSTDGGSSWSAVHVDANPDPQACCGRVTAFAFDPGNTRRVYATVDQFTGDPDGIYVSDNGGLSWTRSSSGLPEPFADLQDVVIDPIRPNILYTGGFCDGVFRSTDRGATWISLPNSGFCIESIALSP
ncbi:MAG: hypothetical protein AAGE01_20980, partial [Pseudomonadota bacterium]